MTVSMPVDHYAVMGNPIAHSQSPRIHALFAASLGHLLNYSAMLVPESGFSKAVEHFFDQGGHLGLSVTLPFKEEACGLAQNLSDRASVAGAVNTLWLDSSGTLCGDNTDGVGLMRDLAVNHQLSVEGMRVLVLGAGGAVRGMLAPLLAADPDSVVIANRTVSKALALVDHFPQSNVSAVGFDRLDGSFDLVINGTSASLHQQLPPLSASAINSGTCCYDMVYSAGETMFNRWAFEQGAKSTMDGLGMLVEQAAEQFIIWRGERPETAPVLQKLRSALSTCPPYGHE